MKRSKEQTRDRILDAAYGLFWRQGFLRVSVDEIAARAGITKRGLYQHFRSKDDLMAAALANASHLAIARLKEFRRPVRRDELIEVILCSACGLGVHAAVVGWRLHARGR